MEMCHLTVWTHSCMRKSCYTPYPALPHLLIQNTGVTCVYYMVVTSYDSISCWYIIMSLFRDRVLAMARDLLQFRASCAKSNSRHWAGITVRTYWFLEYWFCVYKESQSKSAKQALATEQESHFSTLSGQNYPEEDMLSTGFMSTKFLSTKCHIFLKCDINICIIVVRRWRIHADLTII